MNKKSQKTKENHGKSVTNELSGRRRGNQVISFTDNRPEAISQRKVQGMINNSPKTHQLNTIQKMADRYTQEKRLSFVTPPVVQQRQVQQQYASKHVFASARKHYDDGWGDRYKIKKDTALKDDVPDTVKGNGSINLGWYDAPEAEQDPEDRRFEKKCTIAYEDGKYKDETSIYHCGPSGKRHYYNS